MGTSCALGWPCSLRRGEHVRSRRARRGCATCRVHVRRAPLQLDLWPLDATVRGARSDRAGAPTAGAADGDGGNRTHGPPLPPPRAEKPADEVDHDEGSVTFVDVGPHAGVVLRRSSVRPEQGPRSALMNTQRGNYVESWPFPQANCERRPGSPPGKRPSEGMVTAIRRWGPQDKSLTRAAPSPVRLDSPDR
jgi:hypothetical protein